MEKYVFLRLLSITEGSRLYLAFDKAECKYYAVRMLQIQEGGVKGYHYRNEQRKLVGELMKLNHKCIPRICRIVSKEDCLYIIMEFCEGSSIKELLEAGEMNLRRAAVIIRQLGSLFETLHKSQIAGTADNITVSDIIETKNGEIKITDAWLIASKKQRGEFEKNVMADIKSLGRLFKSLAENENNNKYDLILKGCMEQNDSMSFKCMRELNAALDELIEELDCLFFGFVSFVKRFRKRALAVVMIAAAIYAIAVLGADEQDSDERVKVSADTVFGELDRDTQAVGEADEIDEEQLRFMDRWQRISVIENMTEKLAARLSCEQPAEELLFAALKDAEYIGSLLDKEADTIEDLNNIPENNEKYAEAVMDMKIENLSMLSTIYKLLGIRNEDIRKEMYGKAAECIEELLGLSAFREKSVYRLKLAEFVSIKEELGDYTSAISYLESWESENPDCGKELYIAHALILMKNSGNAEKLTRLKEKMDSIDEVREDFRYVDICKKIAQYIDMEEKLKHE